MKIIIAGSRFITDFNVVETAISKSPWNNLITEIVSGSQVGIDRAGETWANKMGLPIKIFIAEWNKYEKGQAGPIRNGQMAGFADALIAIPDPEEKSAGTWSMVGIMKKACKPLFVYKIQEDFIYTKKDIIRWPYWQWVCEPKMKT